MRRAGERIGDWALPVTEVSAAGTTSSVSRSSSRSSSPSPGDSCSAGASPLKGESPDPVVWVSVPVRIQDPGSSPHADCGTANEITKSAASANIAAAPVPKGPKSRGKRPWRFATRLTDSNMMFLKYFVKARSAESLANRPTVQAPGALLKSAEVKIPDSPSVLQIRQKRGGEPASRPGFGLGIRV